jgi:integral membrane sensor domain MASE1
MNHGRDIEGMPSSQQEAAGSEPPVWMRRVRKAGPALFTIFGFWALGVGALAIQGTVWVWPAAGIAIFAAVRRGYRVWPEIACGSLLISLTRWLFAGTPMEPGVLIVAIWIAAGCSVATVALFPEPRSIARSM